MSNDWVICMAVRSFRYTISVISILWYGHWFLYSFFLATSEVIRICFFDVPHHYFVGTLSVTQTNSVDRSRVHHGAPFQNRCGKRAGGVMRTAAPLKHPAPTPPCVKPYNMTPLRSASLVTLVSILSQPYLRLKDFFHSVDCFDPTRKFRRGLLLKVHKR